jgi:hypothetical protein
MFIVQRADSVGQSSDGTAPISGGTPVLSLGALTPSRVRSGLQIKNHSSSYALRVFLSQSETPPTITSTSHHLTIDAGKDRFLAIGGAVRVWLVSADAANTVAFTALELV